MSAFIPPTLRMASCSRPHLMSTPLRAPLLSPTPADPQPTSTSPPLAPLSPKQKTYLSRRLSMYLSEPTMALPPYQFKRVKKSKKAYITRMQIYLDDFDALMAQFES